LTFSTLTLFASGQKSHNLAYNENHATKAPEKLLARIQPNLANSEKMSS